MKVIVEGMNTRTDIIPKVGEVWKHKHDSTIWMRIQDTYGVMGKPIESCQNSFFSIDLDTGLVSHTGLNAKNIELLTPVSNIVYKIKTEE